MQRVLKQIISHDVCEEGKNELTGSLRGNTLKDVVDKRVKNGHSLVGDTSVGVNLLQDWVQVSTSSTRRQQFNSPL
jgi:cyanophycinase-like exopeptidase